MSDTVKNFLPDVYAFGVLSDALERGVCPERDDDGWFQYSFTCDGFRYVVLVSCAGLIAWTEREL